MSSSLKPLGYKNTLSYQDMIINGISNYIEKTVDTKGYVNETIIQTDYFIENDLWHIDFFKNINQFIDQIEKSKSYKKTINFRCINQSTNNEIKLFVLKKLFNDEWTISNAFTSNNYYLKRLAEFINEKYPNITSILQLEKDKIIFEWIDWLENKGIKTSEEKYYKKIDKVVIQKTVISGFLSGVYDFIFNYTDTRTEWEKDVWDIRNLKQYSIEFNNSTSNYYLHFSNINNDNIKSDFKKYIKRRLLSNNNFSWGTAYGYVNFIPKFINFILELEPEWNDLNKLTRKHMEKYFEWLNIYCKGNLTTKNANPEKYKNQALVLVQRFLSDIQIYNYKIAPKINARILISSDDKPSLGSRVSSKIEYVPDYVLSQLFKNINSLNPDVVPIVWIMYKTGLRISDAVSLTQNCLLKINNEYWLQSDIRKTKIKNHRLPIDDELANMTAVLIDISKNNSNHDNNPKNYIFVRYRGSRKGLPFSQSWVRDELNAFAATYNIVNEDGSRYHFKNHAFRHTYGVKMINNGADIVTVQELLAHASPEMTLVYAKILDETKRTVFNNVINQGVFSFNKESKLQEEDNSIPDDILEMLWTNHKLNAIDTPYGTCLQRSGGKCHFAKQPPCLTCNGGTPCRDLCIGVSEFDIKKYEILINSTESINEQAKIYGRDSVVQENEELLKILKDVYIKLEQGSIIYSRLDRLKKIGEKNG